MLTSDVNVGNSPDLRCEEEVEEEISDPIRSSPVTGGGQVAAATLRSQSHSRLLMEQVRSLPGLLVLLAIINIRYNVSLQIDLTSSPAASLEQVSLINLLT